MKNKYVIINKKEANDWCQIANLFIKSLFPYDSAIKQFNHLSSSERIQIRKKIEQCDETRKKMIPSDDQNKENWITNFMVDTHIIATEFTIDPLTVGLCIRPPCNANQKVIVK